MRASAIDPMRTVLILESRLHTARMRLQEIDDLHPLFERRVQDVMRLVSKRDAAVAQDLQALLHGVSR